MAKVTTSYNNWNFNDQHVQQNITGGDFIGSHTIIICASGPKLDYMISGGTGNIPGLPGVLNNILSGHSTEISADTTGNGFAIPIGVVSDIGIQQSRQINKIYEIGSKLSYTVSARTSIGINLTRVQYHGPSLLRMLYAYYPDSKIGGINNRLADSVKDGDSFLQKLSMNGEFESNLPVIKDPAGHANFFLNVASDLFSQPLGLVMYIKDNVGDDVAAIFLEDCNITTHQFGISQNSVVIAEGVGITCDRIVPLQVNVKRSSQLFNTNTLINQVAQSAGLPGF